MIIVEIAGHLGADPEERFTAGGKRVVSLRIATNVRKGGQDETVWWRVNIWDNRFDKMLPHLKKGSAVIVVGEMAKPETYSGKDGSVQVSLTLTAEMLKFSPFGRTDRPAGEPHAHGDAHESFAAKPAFGNQYAGAGASSAAGSGASFAHEESYAGAGIGDDLPF